MPLSAALAAPRVSQTDSPTSEAEPAFYRSALRRQLGRQFGERFALATGPVLPLDHYPGDATAMQFSAAAAVLRRSLSRCGWGWQRARRAPLALSD